MASEKQYGQIKITYFGPGDFIIDPELGALNRDNQTMTWTFLDRSGLNAGLLFPTGGITFPWPPPSPPPPYSKWEPPGTTPTGTSTEYTATANDKVPHGDPRKFYAYMITIERDDTSEDGRRTRVIEMITKFRPRMQHEGLQRAEVIDPPIENEPLP